jgi:hypothetical protein
MKYTVTYKPSAEHELAAIWTAAADRGIVAAAADRLDVLLGRDPMARSESRRETVRIQFEYPLAVLFKVSEPDRIVEVLHIYRTDERS